MHREAEKSRQLRAHKLSCVFGGRMHSKPREGEECPGGVAGKTQWECSELDPWGWRWFGGLAVPEHMQAVTLDPEAAVDDRI